jgi:ABC-type cobalamin transport system permease subunit
LIGGLVEILLGIIHFIWPFQLIKTGEFTNLSSDYMNLLFLCSLSIGLCLSAFGLLSIYFSKKILFYERSAWIYGISQGLIWEIRAIFELILPVKIPLLFISNPTILILPLAFLLGLLFLVPLWMVKEKFIHNEKQ